MTDHEEEETTNIYNILPTRPFGFCGNDNCVYDIKCDPCTWTALEFVERKKTDIPPKDLGKGHIIGLYQ